MKQHEIDAAAILHVILIFDDPLDGFDEGLLFTARQLSRLAGIGLARTHEALSWLLRGGYVYRDRDALRVTLDGRNYWDASRQRPGSARDVAQWRNEVLTGLDARGRQTQIENAAMPSSSRPPSPASPDREIIRRMANAAIKQRTAHDLGLTADELERLMIEGRVKICNGPRKARVDPHIGIFGTDRGSTRAHCNKCRARKK